jgi:hypothetical protein
VHDGFERRFEEQSGGIERDEVARRQTAHAPAALLMGGPMELLSTTLTPNPRGELCEVSPSDPSDVDEAQLRIRQLGRHHRFMLAIAVLSIVLSFMLKLGDDGRISITETGYELPNLCGSRALFNIECPGCGLTRSFVALAAGELQQSLAFHRLGWLLALAMLAQIPYRIFALRSLRYGVANHQWATVCGYFLIAALVANWLLTIAL